MTYLQALESELKQAGVPPRRRARILTEFADHLHENPDAELGAPRLLARQFADVLGTRLARLTAYWAFGVLAVAAIVLVVMFFEGGRTWGGWVGYGSHPWSGYIPSWWVPLMIVWFISAQLALAAGSLALLRAWRLRDQAVINAADAAILRRRTAVGLIAGAVTMLVLPATDLMLARPLTYHLPGGGIEASADRWHSLFAVTTEPVVGVRRDHRRSAPDRGEPVAAADGASRRAHAAPPRGRPRRPHARPGRAGDISDSGAHHARDGWRDRAHHADHRDPLKRPADGLARGLVDAALCMIGFAILGPYLGLRTSGGGGGGGGRGEGGERARERRGGGRGGGGGGRSPRRARQVGSAKTGSSPAAATGQSLRADHGHRGGGGGEEGREGARCAAGANGGIFSWISVWFNYADRPAGCRPDFNNALARTAANAVTADDCVTPTKTRITHFKINQKKRTASFTMEAHGTKKFICELDRNGKRLFRHSCSSQKMYAQTLKRGRYLFWAWGLTTWASITTRRPTHSNSSSPRRRPRRWRDPVRPSATHGACDLHKQRRDTPARGEPPRPRYCFAWIR